MPGVEHVVQPWHKAGRGGLDQRKLKRGAGQAGTQQALVEEARVPVGAFIEVHQPHRITAKGFEREPGGRLREFFDCDHGAHSGRHRATAKSR